AMGRLIRFGRLATACSRDRAHAAWLCLRDDSTRTGRATSFRQSHRARGAMTAAAAGGARGTQAASNTEAAAFVAAHVAADDSSRQLPSGPASASFAIQAEVHDRQQLEIKFDYTLGAVARKERYTIDTYFFIPKNVGICSTNYSRDQF